MKVVARIAGYFLLMFGMVWITAVAGGVLSHDPKWLDPQTLAIGFVVHTACMGLGTWLASWGARAKRLAKAA